MKMNYLLLSFAIALFSNLTSLKETKHFFDWLQHWGTQSWRCFHLVPRSNAFFSPSGLGFHNFLTSFLQLCASSAVLDNYSGLILSKLNFFTDLFL